MAWLPDPPVQAALRRTSGGWSIIDKALADEQRFATQYAVHLNADNRARAKGCWRPSGSRCSANVKGAFKQAYGLAQKKPRDVELGFDDHFSRCATSTA